MMKKVRQRPMNFNCLLSTLIAIKKNFCSFVTARLHSYVINIYKTVNYNHCEREQRSLLLKLKSTARMARCFLRKVL